MPPQRSLPQAHRRAYVITSILSQDIVMGPCSRCVDKGLVYITITAPSSRQPSSCSECTSINMQLSYNIYLVPVAKYAFLHLILTIS